VGGDGGGGSRGRLYLKFRRARQFALITPANKCPSGRGGGGGREGTCRSSGRGGEREREREREREVATGKFINMRSGDNSITGPLCFAALGDLSALSQTGKTTAVVFYPPASYSARAI